LSRIIDQRETAAKLPRGPPTNVWTQRDPVSPTEATPRASRFFRFDETHYSIDDIHRLQAVCTQEHAFATATREPTPDEWNILQGMMAGKIIASELPQFLKRICTITQLVWIHEEIVQRTEGELWVALPPLTKMYNYNQTTRRLVSDIRQSASISSGTMGDSRSCCRRSRLWHTTKTCTPSIFTSSRKARPCNSKI
jgi:hypothetical protein